MKKIDKRVWWSLPIIVGVYLIFRQYSKTTTTNKTLPTDVVKDVVDNVTNTTQPKYSSSYPLKNGSRDTGSPLAPKGLVVNLQKMINTRGYIPSSSKLAPYTKLVEDGIFGSKTEDAVNYWIGKKSVDDEFDLENLQQSLINKLPLTNYPTLF